MLALRRFGKGSSLVLLALLIAHDSSPADPSTATVGRVRGSRRLMILRYQRTAYSVVLILLAIAACATGAGRSLATGESLPIVRIENQHGIQLRVFDGAFQVATLMPGETRLVPLPGRGLRRLKVVGFQYQAWTSAARFEENQRWQLVVANDGKLNLNLR